MSRPPPPTIIAAIFFSFSFCIAPAQAELFRSYWRLQPEEAESVQNVAYGTPFFRQRLIPVRSVVLDESVTPKPGGRIYGKGTPLYMLFSKDGRSAYCTIKDRSLGNQAKTLFLPILDDRPCFRDSDADGRFDAVFYVSDALTGPPAQGGNMDAITAIEPTSFKEVDPTEYPEDMIAYFQLSKGNELAHIRLEVMFENAGSRTRWRDVLEEGGYTIEALNVRIVIHSTQDESAQIEIEGNGIGCIRRIRGGLLSEACPAP